MSAEGALPVEPGRRNRRATNDLDRVIANRVRQQRVLKGVSQEKLGEALGLTFQQIQKYEKATNRIGAARLVQIAKFLNVPVSYFYDGLEEGATPEVAPFSYWAICIGHALDRQITDERARERIATLLVKIIGEVANQKVALKEVGQQ